MQVYHIVSLLLIIEYILAAASPNCNVFRVKFLVQLILNLCELFLRPKITVTQFSHILHYWVVQERGVFSLVPRAPNYPYKRELASILLPFFPVDLGSDP